MRNVTDPDRLRAPLLNALPDTIDLHETLNSFSESNNATPIMNNAALISMLHAMAERISMLERQLDRAKENVWKGKGFPDDVICQLANGVSPIKVFRKHRGKTQKELAKMARCTTAYISQLELRNRPGSMKMLRRLANLLDVDVHELIES